MRMHGQSSQRRQRGAGAENAADSFRRTLPLVAGVLEKAVQREGCILCLAVRDVEERALFSFLYEGISTPSAREEFVRAGGFCPRHFRMALQQTRASGYVGPFEIGSVCQLLTNAAAEKIRQTERIASSSRWAGFRKDDSTSTSGEPGEKCILCADSRGKEQDLVLALESLAADPAMAQHVEANGLCLRHGTMSMLTWETSAHQEWLRRVLTEQVHKLKSDVDEFLRKHDHRFRNEPPGPEADVNRRAMEFLLGPEAMAEEKGR